MSSAQVSVVRGTFSRPNNTTAYASGQLVANDTVAANVRPVSYLCIGDKTRGGLIRRVRLRKSSANTANAVFRVHLYRSAEITCANGDGGAWLTNRAIEYIGAMDVTCDRAFSDGAIGNGLPLLGSEINFDSDNVWLLVEARGAYVPAANEVFTIDLEVIQN